jgi:hypothetical protein
MSRRDATDVSAVCIAESSPPPVTRNVALRLARDATRWRKEVRAWTQVPVIVNVSNSWMCRI